MQRYVFDFSEGDKDQKDLLGGKGEPGGDGGAGWARPAAAPRNSMSTPNGAG
jgi:hypothetical protein